MLSFALVIGILLATAIAVMQTPLPRRTLPFQFGLRKLVLGIAVCSVTFATGRWFWCCVYDVPHLKELIVEAKPLVLQLDDWKTRHGSYPHTLKEAGLDSPVTDFGTFDYYKHQDGWCMLSIYLPRFHERLEWDSESRSWGTDMRIVKEIGWSEAEVNRW